MAGTKAGGQAAAATNKERYGKDFYEKIGAKGGSASGAGGFAHALNCTNPTCEYAHTGPHLVRQCAGAKGGTKSRRVRQSR